MIWQSWTNADWLLIGIVIGAVVAILGVTLFLYFMAKSLEASN